MLYYKGVLYVIINIIHSKYLKENITEYFDPQLFTNFFISVMSLLFSNRMNYLRLSRIMEDPQSL